ncbi:MAG TPA: hypothetical protein PLA03_11660 [Acidobacteriota bacterium]|nr:hypothetical protein [Acidobacteriota bacterium]
MPLTELNRDYQPFLSLLEETTDPEQKLALIKAAILRDRYILAKFLGYDDARHPWDPLHIYLTRDFIPQVEAQENYWAAWFGPRGTYKTSIEEVAIIANILKNPSITIGIGSWKLDVAERIVTSVRSKLENEDFIRLFPEILYKDPANKAPLWKTRAFTVKRPEGIREATMTAFSLESMPTSQHFDKIYCDDVVERRNTNTIEAIEKTKEIVQDLPSLLVRGQGSIEARGTFWDLEDWHVKTLLNSKLWQVFRMSAIADEHCFNPLGTAKGELMFPSVLNWKTLEDFKAAMTEFHFGCQFLLQAETDSGGGHLPGKLEYYAPDQNGWPKDVDKSSPVYIMCDLGTGTADGDGKGKDPDDCAIAVMTIGGSRTDYSLLVVDGIAKNMGWHETAEWLYFFHQKWGGIAGIEEIGTLKAFEDTLLHEAANRGYVLPHFAIKGKSSGGGPVKESIKILEQFTRYGRLKIRPAQSCSGDTREFFQKIEYQFRRWPKVLHDDVLDAISMGASHIIPQMIVKPKQAKAPVNYEIIDLGKINREAPSFRRHGRAR